MYIHFAVCLIACEKQPKKCQCQRLQKNLNPKKVKEKFKKSSYFDPLLEIAESPEGCPEMILGFLF